MFNALKKILHFKSLGDGETKRGIDRRKAKDRRSSIKPIKDSEREEHLETMEFEANQTLVTEIGNLRSLIDNLAKKEEGHNG